MTETSSGRVAAGTTAICAASKSDWQTDLRARFALIG
jgi:hypothetical protein